jgi:AraC-like DNA-binding protein
MAADRTPESGPDGPADLSPVSIDYLRAPPELEPYLTTLFVLSCGEAEIQDLIPAGMGIVYLFLTGQGTLEFHDGHREGPHPCSLITPTTAASIAHIDGPMVAVGAALSPLGWAALAGVPADADRDRLRDATEYFGAELAELLAELRTAHESGAETLFELATRLAHYFGTRLKPVNPRHAQLIARVGEWLSSAFDPPLSDLEARAAYSGRQLQRLVERYFGVPPKQLVRKYRVLRVAALLQDPATPDEQVAELVNLFYDQSHMIREMRHYLGRTPARLVTGETPLLAATSGLRNYTEVRPNFARIPDN